MLAYKAWRESRTRFLLSAGALGWFCLMFVVMRPFIQYAAGRTFAQFVDDAIYVGSVRNIFVLFIVAFGMGGLAQEAAVGSALFTLALPITRARLIAVRAAVGLMEVVALSFLPTVAVLGLSRIVGESYSAAEAFRYSIQWAATGSVLFAVAFLLSVRFNRGYAAMTASILVLTTYLSILNVAAIRAMPALNVFALMDRPHPSPARLIGALATAVSMIACAAWATERQDF
jgi:ABC-2 type transport system permease protein